MFPLSSHRNLAESGCGGDDADYDDDNDYDEVFLSVRRRRCCFVVVGCTARSGLSASRIQPAITKDDEQGTEEEKKSSGETR